MLATARLARYPPQRGRVVTLAEMVDEIGRPYEFLFRRLDGEGAAVRRRVVLELLAPFLPAGAGVAR